MRACFCGWLPKPSRARSLRGFATGPRAHAPKRTSTARAVRNLRYSRHDVDTPKDTTVNDVDVARPRQFQERTSRPAQEQAYNSQPGGGVGHSNSTGQGFSGLVEASPCEEQSGVDRITSHLHPPLFKEGAQHLRTLWDKNGAFEQMRFQADVTGGSGQGRLVDDKVRQNDAGLWADLLQFRERHDNAKGVRDIWQGLQARKVDLPTSGEHADTLWLTFLRVFSQGRKNERPLESLVQHAMDLKQRTGHHYPQFYAGLVGALIRRGQNAVPWHLRLASQDMAPFDALKQVAPRITRAGKEAHRRFKDLYKIGLERDLYDIVMPEVFDRRKHDESRSWHDFFAQSGDLPGPELASSLLVQTLLSTGGKSNVAVVRHDSANLLAEAVRPSTLVDTPFTRASMNTIMGNVHGIKKREISDTFCARLFATQVFPLELVIKSLHFFGVEELGPLGVREMAIRSGNINAMRQSIGQLRSLNIDPGTSAYAHLARRVAASGRPALFDAFIANDAHPEVYGDVETQDKLLAMHLANGDWQQVHLTLLALSLIAPRTSTRAWNTLLQHYTMIKDYPSIKYMLRQIQARRIRIAMRSLTLLHRYCLTHRSPGKRPAIPAVVPPLQTLQLVTQAYIYAAKGGQYVNPLLWVECMKRYGMSGQFAEMEKLTMFLVSHYRSKKWSPVDRYTIQNTKGTGQLRVGVGAAGTYSARLAKDSYLSKMYLRRVFPKQMIHAIVTWGFNSAAHKLKLYHLPLDKLRASPTGLPATQPWAAGISLIKWLRREPVVWAPSMFVRNALRLRLKLLFGPAYSTDRFNNMVRRTNRLSIAHYIRHANEVWGNALLNVPLDLLESDRLDLETEARILYALFGMKTRTSLKRRESADILTWAASLAHRSRDPFKSIAQQKKEWTRSPYRTERLRLNNTHRVSPADSTEPTELGEHIESKDPAFSAYTPPNN